MHIGCSEKAAAASWRAPGYSDHFSAAPRTKKAGVSNYAVTVRSITNKRFGR
jgi:hypothetical protein